MVKRIQTLKEYRLSPCWPSSPLWRPWPPWPAGETFPWPPSLPPGIQWMTSFHLLVNIRRSQSRWSPPSQFLIFHRIHDSPGRYNVLEIHFFIVCHRLTGFTRRDVHKQESFPTRVVFAKKKEDDQNKTHFCANPGSFPSLSKISYDNAQALLQIADNEVSLQFVNFVKFCLCTQQLQQNNWRLFYTL